MSEPTNEERIAAARKAMGAVEKYGPFDADSIVDLVTDLLHLAWQEGIEPGYITHMAEIHFDAEVEEEANHG